MGGTKKAPITVKPNVEPQNYSDAEWLLLRKEEQATVIRMRDALHVQKCRIIASVTAGARDDAMDIDDDAPIGEHDMAAAGLQMHSPGVKRQKQT